MRDYKTITLETNRLILRKGTIEDFIKVYEYDYCKLRDIGNEFVYEKYDPEIVRKWFPNNDINAYYEKNEQNHVYDWIIYLKDSNEPIGNLASDYEDNSINSAELTYNLHPHYWGNGYMPEAVKEVITFLFKMGYDNIICGYDEGNNKLKRVIEKLGFIPYKVKKAAWIKNGIPIDSYITIMSKERWFYLNNML
jgi:RimJ/RimL family protein N-acetyltransferase